MSDRPSYLQVESIITISMLIFQNTASILLDFLKNEAR